MFLACVVQSYIVTLATDGWHLRGVVARQVSSEVKFLICAVQSKIVDFATGSTYIGEYVAEITSRQKWAHI